MRTALGTVVGLLVRGEYAALASMTGGRRLSAAEIEHAVRTYGRTLVPPPEDLPPDVEVVRDRDDGRTSHVVMSLWTEEEGQSDLSVEVSLIEVGDGLFDIELDDIRVM